MRYPYKDVRGPLSVLWSGQPCSLFMRLNCWRHDVSIRWLHPPQMHGRLVLYGELPVQGWFCWDGREDMLIIVAVVAPITGRAASRRSPCMTAPCTVLMEHPCLDVIVINIVASGASVGDAILRPSIVGWEPVCLAVGA